MKEETKDKIIFFLIGLIVGGVFTVLGGVFIYKTLKGGSALVEQSMAVKKKSHDSQQTAIKSFELSFENSKDRDVFKPSGSSTSEIVADHATHGKKSLLVKIPTGSSYPGLEWEVYGKDTLSWKGANAFGFDVYNNTEDFIALEVKFKSGKKYPKKTFTFPIQLKPLAMNNIRIPISTLANNIDVANVSYIKLFASKPKTNYFLYFDNFEVK